MFCTCQCQDGGKVSKCYEWRCQGIKRHVTKPKHTKRHVKKDSTMHFVERFWKKFWTFSQIPPLKAGKIIRIWTKCAFKLFPYMTCHHLITPTRGLVPCVQCTGTWPGQLLFKQPSLPPDSWLFKVHENFLMQKLCTLCHIMTILTITPPITLLTEIKRKPTLIVNF